MSLSMKHHVAACKLFPTPTELPADELPEHNLTLGAADKRIKTEFGRCWLREMFKRLTSFGMLTFQIMCVCLCESEHRWRIRAEATGCSCSTS